MKRFKIKKLISIFKIVEYGQYDAAVDLAEKYQDFNILIEVCDKTDNKQRLHDYMERFENEGFSKAVFNWYVWLEESGFRQTCS